MRGLALTAVLFSLAASGAWAQETVSTASPADSHPPGSSAAPAPVDDGIARDTTETTEVVAGPCGPTIASDDPSSPPDTHPHGEVSVGVGTNGYREVSGYVCKRTANGGSVAIGVATQQGGWGRR